ncbi:hypothetical protein [Cytobacillus stercorigallinarum]|nr:hypothetical protein [Cytobacillus stercorigallinarum]
MENGMNCIYGFRMFNKLVFSSAGAFSGSAILYFLQKEFKTSDKWFE